MLRVDASHKIDRKRIRILSVLLILPLVIEPITVLTSGNSAAYTILLHSLFLLWALFVLRRTFSKSDVMWMTIMFSVLLFHFFLFPATRDFYLDKGMLFVYVLYLPISIICVRKIKHWDSFFETFKPFVYVATIIAIYLIFFTDESAKEDDLNYMQFSYFLLPFAVAAYVLCREVRNFKCLICLLVFLISLLVFSARATIGFLFIFIIIYELLQVENIKALSAFVVILGGISFYIMSNIDAIVTYLSGISLFEDSRFLMKLAGDELMVSQGRELIKMDVEKGLNVVGIDYSGFFGDRFFLGGRYPHNIYYEVILSMGWLIGPIVLFVFLLYYILAWIKTPYKKILLFFTLTLFARYLISGSYIAEGRFWLFFFILISMYNNVNRKYEKNISNSTYL